MPVLLSLAALQGRERGRTRSQHCATVAAEMPLVGFYLQPAVGGIRSRRGVLAALCARSTMSSASRWRRSTATPRSMWCAASSRRGAEERITLYTGNDDHIVLDLVRLPFMRDGRPVTVRFRGGLLGHWSVWTQGRRRTARALQGGRGEAAVPPDLLALDSARHRLQRRLLRRRQRFPRLSSPAATRCCAARACSRDAGASIRTRV